jgi:ATP-binding protein involved in chromosome partitioning
MGLETELKKLNITEGCNRKCEDCERYFECTLPFKSYFQEKGILRFIKENLKGVTHKVVVLGGKGGVGKSMLAVNVAAGLAKRGKKVALLDQVYDCPAVPTMLGVPEDARLKIGEKGLIPYLSKWGVAVVSTGLVLGRDDVIIWFHEMKRNATEELLAAVDYGDVDYLIADIPAGTSSETVNILKYLPDITGALLITVPSGVSQNVARKCIYITRQAGVPMIGVVENMSDTECPHCHAPVSIISRGAGEKMSLEEGVRFLAKIPISIKVSTSLDDGEPFVVKYPESEEAVSLERVVDEVIRHCEKSHS